MTEQSIPKDGKDWSKQELFSLQNRIEHGRTIAHIATFLGRTEAEVREKAAQLGLKIPD
jgi:predicted transcriptional regulator